MNLGRFSCINLYAIAVDFSSSELTMQCAEMCAKKGKILISGTTGLTNEEKEKLKEYSEKCVIVHSGNMSIGINLLMNLVEETASLLGQDYDAEILEMHHKNKKDAPSGTALMLGESVANGRNLNFGEVCRKVRDGNIGPRESNEIGIAVLRGGDVVGEHTVIFSSRKRCANSTLPQCRACLSKSFKSPPYIFTELSACNVSSLHERL